MLAQRTDASDTDGSASTGGAQDSPYDKPRRTKVRTGCSVCKARHVKCDELKPFCHKCVATGRKCSGYTPPPPRKQWIRRSKYDCIDATPISRSSSPEKSLDHNARQMMTLTQPWISDTGLLATLPLSLHGITDVQEQRCLHYFQTRASHAISGYFEADFWNYIVLQVCHTEPMVRHGLLALSSLYESHEISHLPTLLSTRDKCKSLKSFATQQYMKAVRLLSSKDCTQDSSPTLVLVSCLIFIWIEFLQDNLEDALIHLKSGLQILSDHHSQNLFFHQTHSTAPISRLFTRLHTQATLHGTSTSSFDPNAVHVHPTQDSAKRKRFATILDARSALDECLNATYRFHRLVEQPGYLRELNATHPFPDPLSIESQRQIHLEQLSSWHKAFLGSEFYSTNLLPRSSNTAASAAADGQDIAPAALAQLEVQHHLARNTLQTLFTRTPMVYDLYTADFAHMLSLSRIILAPHYPHTTMPTRPGPFVLPFDTSTMAPLFYVAIKCRVLPVREEALALLNACPSREGMWYRASVVDFARWKLEFEESRRRGREVLPEDARIWAERLTGVDEHGGAVLGFRRGADLGSTEGHSGVEVDNEVQYEEAVTKLGTRLAGLIGT